MSLNQRLEFALKVSLPPEGRVSLNQCLEFALKVSISARRMDVFKPALGVCTESLDFLQEDGCL